MNWAQENLVLKIQNTKEKETQDDFLKDVIRGLSSSPKTLNPKYFYDEIGSSLFEEICKLNEYYVTRTENKIYADYSQFIASYIPENATIIEPGSGSATKIRYLLNHAKKSWDYVPFEISSQILTDSSSSLLQDYPHVEVTPVEGDFTKGYERVERVINLTKNRVVFFPGSTLGNFDPFSAYSFLTQTRKFVGSTGMLIIGVDLIKDKDVLERAYSDSKGITAQFNLNLLNRINTELGADFDLGRFEHHAFFNSAESRIEMHLRARQAFTVRIQDQIITFKKGETIHTENSHKYDVSQFQRTLEKTGFKLEKLFTDEKSYFGIFVCKAIEKENI